MFEKIKNSQYILPISGLIICFALLVYFMFCIITRRNAFDCKIQQTSNEVVEMYIRQIENAYADQHMELHMLNGCRVNIRQPETVAVDDEASKKSENMEIL